MSKLGTEEGVQPDVSYVMSGNRISAKTLDLNCEFKQISKKLNRIIEETFNIS